MNLVAIYQASRAFYRMFVATIPSEGKIANTNLGFTDRSNSKANNRRIYYGSGKRD